MNCQEAIEYLQLTHVIEPTVADAGTEDALTAVKETVADLRALLEAIIEAVDNDSALQEQMVIAHFGHEMPFATAIRQARAALGKEAGG